MRKRVRSFLAVSATARSIRSPFFPAVLLLLLSTGLVACGEAVATQEPVFLQAAGAPEASAMIEALAEGFQAATDSVSVEVNDPGSSAALQALQAGDVDLAIVSWPPADLLPDQRHDWHAAAVARDGLAVIVHPDNPLRGAGLLQLQDLFAGRAAEWAAVGGGDRQGPVHPVVREDGSGARAAFDALVMEGNRVTPLAVVAPSPSAVLAYVASDVRAIGYVSARFVTPDVKLLEVEGLIPAGETVAAGSYPLAYDFWLVTDGAPQGVVRQFVDWILGPAGQEIVGRFFQKAR